MGEGWLHTCGSVRREVWVPGVESRCPFCGRELEHARHNEEIEFDIRCELCHARVRARSRADLRQMLLDRGLSLEEADEFLVELDRIATEFKAKLDASE